MGQGGTSFCPKLASCATQVEPRLSAPTPTSALIGNFSAAQFVAQQQLYTRLITNLKTI